VGPPVQFPPKPRCDWWGVEKRRFDPMGGIQWNSEPTSPPVPLLKLIPIMQSFQDFPAQKNLEQMGCSTLRKSQRFDQKRYNEPKINRIPDFVVFLETVQKGFSRHIWVDILIVGPVKGVRTSPSAPESPPVATPASAPTPPVPICTSGQYSHVPGPFFDRFCSGVETS